MRRPAQVPAGGAWLPDRCPIAAHERHVDGKTWDRDVDALVHAEALAPGHAHVRLRHADGALQVARLEVRLEHHGVDVEEVDVEEVDVEEVVELVVVEEVVVDEVVVVVGVLVLGGCKSAYRRRSHSYL